ncbi:MAG: hypothetical protein EZS28_016349 [Streblomastix strix]|uniref:Uncharacterized protein n=1 Tax=Streblomastix strix TaxID=222440 RepID=A0A5J4VZW9_9EUKA|nr:MAG: hypothetical protein EZS28_016349 [Streblomastix strix]
MDYPWTIEPNPDSGSEYDSETSPPPTRQVSSLPHGYIADRGHELLTKFLDAVGLSRQALLIGGQKFQSIRRYYAMATLDDWMKSKQYSIQEVLRMKPGFIIPEVMAWFAGQHKIPKSTLNKQSYIKTMLQLLFDREPIHDTPSALTYRAISNCDVRRRRYQIWTFRTPLQTILHDLRITDQIECNVWIAIFLSTKQRLFWQLAFCPTIIKNIRVEAAHYLSQYTGAVTADSIARLVASITKDLIILRIRMRVLHFLFRLIPWFTTYAYGL